MSCTLAEKRRLSSLSYAINAERLAVFSLYLEAMGRSTPYRRDMVRCMENFARENNKTGLQAYESYREQLCSWYGDSIAEKFATAYRHYQRMCESGWTPGQTIQEEATCRQPITPRHDSWKPYGLMRGHPARMLFKGIFEEKDISRARFRQTAPNEWMFEGDEIRYRVAVSAGNCTLEARSKRTGHVWMRREYILGPNGRMEIAQAGIPVGGVKNAAD